MEFLLNLIMKKHQTKTNQRIFYKVTDRLFQNVKVKKHKERLRDYTKLKENEEPMTVKGNYAMLDPELDCGVGE